MKVIFGIVVIVMTLFHSGTSTCYWDPWTQSWDCNRLSIHLTTTRTSKSELSRICYDCMCELASGCVNGTTCSDDACGPLRISRKYWIDAGSITLDNDDAPAHRAHVACLNDLDCAFRVVRAYMEKYLSSCVTKNIIFCSDYYRIFLLGGHNCNSTIEVEKQIALENCLQEKGSV